MVINAIFINILSDTDISKMDKKYQPTSKEIFNEMKKDVCTPFNKIKENSVEFLEYCLMGFVAGLCPHYVPTITRLFREDSKKEKKDEKITFSEGFAAGLGVGAITFVGEVGLYGYTLYKGHPEALLIPAATNVISGLYEWGKNAEKRVSERHEGKLEKGVEEK